MTDPDDNYLLALAAAGADFLVTGDKRHCALGVYNGTKIVTVRDFLTNTDDSHEWRSGSPAVEPVRCTLSAGPVLPALIAVAGERATARFLEFFASTIRNSHTRRAYARAVGDFLAWCKKHGVPSIAAVQPLHVATWIEGRTRELSAPTVKQQLAAVRHLFDWLVMSQVVPLNPAASVRGPAHSVRKGKTPVLDPAEARTLLDNIEVSTPIGLRDRALIALMVYSFGL